MFRNIWFQAHWLIGITAGIVLAIVGLTGAMLAFETPLQQWLNRDTRTVAISSAAVMTPSGLLEAVAQQVPGKRVTTLQFSSDPTAAVRVGFAPDANARGGGRGPGRGESRYVNPYTGALLEADAARGQAFFRATRSLHRWLTLDGYGKQELGRKIVGACTALCIVLTLSGLYLRWPRRIGSWRVWLTFNPRLKGRAFLWHLHAVLGTWVLIGFLLMSLTGLYWSYNWYRDGLYALAGIERPAGREQANRPAGAAPRAERARGGERPGDSPDEAVQPAILDAAWTSFKTLPEAAQLKTATLTFEPGRPIEVRYLRTDSRHDRANNVAQIDPRTGALLKHERYEDKRTGEKFMASIFPLHSGSFFGLPGSVLYMIASLGMPVFAVTGWMMYLDRRRKKRASATRREPSAGWNTL